MTDDTNPEFTAEEMHSMLANDGDIDSDEVTVENVEEMLDELVEEGVWTRTDRGTYRVASTGAAVDYVSRNSPTDPRN